jgi:hypothetical protein
MKNTNAAFRQAGARHPRPGADKVAGNDSGVSTAGGYRPDSQERNADCCAGLPSAIVPR